MWDKCPKCGKEVWHRFREAHMVGCRAARPGDLDADDEFAKWLKQEETPTKMYEERKVS